MNIIKKLSPNFALVRKGYVPELIVLHVMDGTLAGTDSWFATTESQVSSHYGIGLKGEIHQYVEEENTAWANGRVDKPSFKLYKPNINPNLYTISIEHEGKDLSMVQEAQINASVELICTIASKWKIPIDRDHIIGHYQIYSLKPNCPATNKDVIDRIVRMAQERSKIAPSTNKKEIILQKVQELTKLINEI